MACRPRVGRPGAAIDHDYGAESFSHPGRLTRCKIIFIGTVEAWPTGILHAPKSHDLDTIQFSTRLRPSFGEGGPSPCARLFASASLPRSLSLRLFSPLRLPPLRPTSRSHATISPTPPS